MKYLVSNSTLESGVTFTRSKYGGTNPNSSVSGTTIKTTGSWNTNTNYTSYCYALLNEEITGHGQKIIFTCTQASIGYKYNPESYMVLYDIDADTYTQIDSSPYTMPRDGKNYKIGAYAFVQGWGSGTGTIDYTYQLNEVAIKGDGGYIKVNGTWKEATTYVKVNGTWKEATPKIKVSGTWKGA